MSLRVLSVASEAVPLVKTGGLADVVGALPGALAPHGVDVTTLLPGYAQVMAALGKPSPPVHQWDALLGAPARLIATSIAGHALLVLDCPALFDRPGTPYADADGRDWADNWRRFAALGRAAADIAGGVVSSLPFDILHAHDWQAGLALAYQRFAPATPPLAGRRRGKPARIIPGVMTIHNIAFQGHFGADVFPRLGLPATAWSMYGVEYHGGVGYLKAGMEAAAIITTVSPGYAREIREPAFGMGLEALVVSRGDDVRGLINGIDTTAWNPTTDPALPSPYTYRTLTRRRANKRALESEFALETGDGPLFVVISRLTWQKGMDVLAEGLDHLVALGGRLALLGSGDAGITAALHRAASRHRGRVAIRIGYDEALSHLCQGGGDAILVPSRFEPCGLTQLYGLAYGCVPVVARTGGLADSIVDANLAALNAGVATGIHIASIDQAGLADAITRTIALFGDKPAWRRMRINGMNADFSWARCGGAYAALYRELAAEQA